jgi:pyrimidine operon attenuation protein/uracil phosphoribosyltransferase
MACQILERNYEEQRILLAGIRHGGEGVAVRLARELIELNPGLGVDVTFIALDKSQPELSTVDIGVDVSLWSKGVVVVVDDVAHTGRTLLHALRPFLGSSFLRLQLAVLVDRAHKTHPIHPDYVGLSLATTLQEHVEVVQSDESFTVWLL